jgi:tRNA (guanine37-N1)-methyltransferase
MRIEIATLFVEMCEMVCSESIVGRARRAGYLDLRFHQIREFTTDKHNRVDDTPYGGGMGMLMQADPIYRCYKAATEKLPEDKKPYVIYMSPQGSVLNQCKAKELATHDHLVILCGHYEGVDERIIEEIVDEEISIGDYVLTGGELPAMVVIDTVARMIEGVLDSAETASVESHYNGLLEYPQYTRPPEFLGRKVPEILSSGHHANIEKWRKQQSLEITKRLRPDLLEE